MSNYYEVFKQRLTADGATYKNQIEKIAQRNFDRYLAETPTAIDIKYLGEEYKVAIVENKQDEFRLSKQMLTSLKHSFPIGSLIYWDYFEPLDCPENFWLIWKQQQNSIQDHNVYYISRCNHKLKWIDSSGVRHEQYVYEFSSKENMIRATFKSRVQEIIASEPNKFMEIIMPFTTDIKREQRFIVDGEAWYVIEFDSSSVEGITYITLGEDRKDLQQDLLLAKGDNEDLANYANENKNYILVLDNNPIVEKDTSYIIKPYYYENGILIENSIFNFYVNNELINTGTFLEESYDINTVIEIKLYNNENIKSIVNLQVNEEPQVTKIYSIIGDNYIKWGKTAIYSIDLQENGIILSPQEVSYNINNEELATLEQDGNIAYITANNKRKTGKIILSASGNDFSIEKEISIVSLW
jgi:hypothetical protein